VGIEGLGTAAVGFAQRVNASDVSMERLEQHLGRVSALVC